MSWIRSLAEQVDLSREAGGWRSESPRAMLDRLLPLAPSMGITRVSNITGLDHIGIPVAMACRPNSMSISVAQGKGVTLDAALTSALMEAAETFYAETAPRDALFSYDEAGAANQALDPLLLPRVRGAGGRVTAVPIWWSVGRDLVRGSTLYVPYDLVHTDYRLQSGAGLSAFQVSTNGLASGASLAEAICHGLAELIERDALSQWLALGREERTRTRLRLDSGLPRSCREVLDMYQAAGVSARVWNITSDVRVPAFLCLISDHDNPYRRTSEGRGSGCHPVREVALLRALTEAAQSRLGIISGGRDDLIAALYKGPYDREQRRDITPEVADFASIPECPTVTLADWIDFQLAALDKAGMATAAVCDLSVEGSGLAVARVVVEGLEGIAYKANYRYGRRLLRRMLERGIAR
ncbi:YcaO-like family protein [Parafrankia elaeagni]|uniref:YcaO-like family protein n=1 Tax=Parafrankia elaeagni TaxID=222534 RepID=UPI0003A827C4|nr:YcaO-like family protein [Parafrankia elaeagni]